MPTKLPARPLPAPRANPGGQALLWLTGALHALVLLSFLFVAGALAPAHAAEADACQGRNLLDAMKVEDPARFAVVEGEAAAIPNGKGRFWKVEKPGLAPSYLLGTMHVSDPRVLDLPETARQAAAGAAVVIVESDEILDEKKAAMALLARPELTMITDGSKITDHLSPEDAARLDQGLKTRGLSIDGVARMQPWIISSVVALPACELTRKAEGVAFLDQQIAADAVKRGIPVKGLETMAEQLGAMADLPISFHLKALIETLALGDEMTDIMQTMTDLYVAGDIGMTMPMLKAVTPGQGDESSYAAFEKRLVDDRNGVMAERSAPLFAKGNAFMAVGALHLPGEAGLVARLRSAGYTVTAFD